MSWQISEYSLTLEFFSRQISKLVNPKFETAIKYFQKENGCNEICKVLQLAAKHGTLKSIAYSKNKLNISLGLSSHYALNVFTKALDDLEASIATKKE